jgi:hypothetical protein
MAVVMCLLALRKLLLPHPPTPQGKKFCFAHTRAFVLLISMVYARMFVFVTVSAKLLPLRETLGAIWQMKT